nr:unnamed protein product [Callosobruchus chinensis]
MSSDMNPIEHVWDYVSRAIFNRNNPPRSTQELIVAATEEWDNIPQERTFNRVISTATIRRRVLASGLRCRRPLRVPLLTARHRTARLQWARAHQDWLLPQWRNVLFSDKSTFGLVSDDYRERVWREREE